MYLQDEIVSSLRPLKIISLRWSISCFFPRKPQGDGRSVDTESNHAAEEYYKGLSLDALAGRVTDVQWKSAWTLRVLS